MDMSKQAIDDAFRRAWAEKEAEGYQYGRDALEQVRFGFEIGLAAAQLETDRDRREPVDPGPSMEEHNAAVDRYRTALETLRAFADDDVSDFAELRDAAATVLARRDDVEDTVCWGVACPHEARALDESYADHCTIERKLDVQTARAEVAEAEVRRLTTKHDELQQTILDMRREAQAAFLKFYGLDEPGLARAWASAERLIRHQEQLDHARFMAAGWRRLAVQGRECCVNRGRKRAPIEMEGE